MNLMHLSLGNSLVEDKWRCSSYFPFNLSSTHDYMWFDLVPIKSRILKRTKCFCARDRIDLTSAVTLGTPIQELNNGVIHLLKSHSFAICTTTVAKEVMGLCSKFWNHSLIFTSHSQKAWESKQAVIQKPLLMYLVGSLSWQPCEGCHYWPPSNPTKEIKFDHHTSMLITWPAMSSELYPRI